MARAVAWILVSPLVATVAAASPAAPAPARAAVDADRTLPFPEQPAATASGPEPACGVRIVRAPADLRADVEAHLQAESIACTGTLEVWLVPSSGGVYVQARDGAGRIRERVVPDAAVAATLIASWLEVDAAAPLWSAPPAEAASAPTPVRPPSRAPVVAMAPELDPEEPPGDGAAARVSRPRTTSWRPRAFTLTASGVATGSGMYGGGGRLGLEVVDRGRWRLGSALAATVVDTDGTEWHLTRNDTQSRLTGQASFELLGTLRHEWPIGRVAVIPQVGAGIGVHRHDVDVMDGTSFWQTDEYQAGMRAEAALLVAVRCAPRWHLEGGVVTGATWFMPGTGEDHAPSPSLDGSSTFLLGVRYQP